MKRLLFIGLIAVCLLASCGPGKPAPGNDNPAIEQEIREKAIEAVPPADSLELESPDAQ